MDRLLNAMTGLSVLLIVMVLVSVRRARIRVEYSVAWLAGAAALLVFSRARVLLRTVADLLGVTYPPLALVLLVGSVFLLIFYRFSLIISQLKDDNIALAQRVAILEYHLQALKDHAAGC
ncbi:MAG TPA: DUF2304 domain-containing protein [Bryobacteraceae bacterium]|nr:DUF2304 domain-containing protein [Bryobacteraceae bacterium]